MKLSDIFKFKLFEGGDKANLKIVNENFEIAEKELDATNKEIAGKVTEINDRITELNGLLGGKLDVSKIANNLVTTEAGYALDARMGKALGDEMNKHRIIWNDDNLTLYCDERIGVMHLVGFGVYTLPQWGWLANFGQLTDTHKPPTNIMCNGHVTVNPDGVISTSQELSNSMEVINVSWRIRQ